MLYVTTRNNRDAFTVQRVLNENRGPDGGFYRPFSDPEFTAEEITALAEKPFNQRIADVLNLLFNTKLTSWDVDFCVGRYPVRLASLNPKTIIAESWHNPDWNYERMVTSLTAHLCDRKAIPTNWGRIAVRIAVLFGIFGELKRSGIDSADISVVSGDFSGPISAWYARKWGLPIGNIVCCCNENNSLWDLICQGYLRTNALSIPTFLPEADIAVPDDLERLIYECGGLDEAERYLAVCRSGGIYTPEDAVLRKLRQGLYVSVVSSQRIETTIPGVFRTSQYLFAPGSALAYAGLMDYRAKTGATRHAVILAEKSAICEADTVAEKLGISVKELKKYF